MKFQAQNQSVTYTTPIFLCTISQFDPATVSCSMCSHSSKTLSITTHNAATENKASRVRVRERQYRQAVGAHDDEITKCVSVECHIPPDKVSHNHILIWRHSEPAALPFAQHFCAHTSLYACRNVSWVGAQETAHTACYYILALIRYTVV